MPDNEVMKVLQPNPEHRRIAAGQYERANQVIATHNYDYGIRLLLSCCKLEPANLIYRQALRRTEKTKYNNNMRGSWLAWLTTSGTRAKLKSAKRSRDYLKVLERAEQVLARNPWDIGVQMDMAEAADKLGLLDLAIWTLEQARQKNPRDVTLNRALARLYEKRGNYTQAIALWEMIRKAVPTDNEAQGKAKDLAASETIARGGYQDAVREGSSATHRLAGSGSATHGVANASASPESSGYRVSATKDSSPTTTGGGPPAPPRDPAQVGSERIAGEVAKLRARLEADPTNPNIYLQLANVYRRAGQIDPARELLQTGLGPTGNNFELGLELADLEIEPFRRNLTVAEEKLKNLTQDNQATPQGEEVRKQRLRLLREINSREMELFRKKAERYPTEMSHRFELGVRLLRAGQVDEAIRELQAARGDSRLLWKALMYLGYCFKTRNNWRLAKRNFEEAVQNLPPGDLATRKELLFQLAQGSAEAGELTEAVDVGHELANLDFGFRDIGRLLDDWQTRLQQSKVATDK
jgi:tetratricopeptide (TPR) repeat protein